MSAAKNNKQAPSSDSTDLRDSWEYKTGKIILRIVAALFFLTYLLLAMPHAMSWGWQAYYRQQPLSKLEVHIDEALKGEQKVLLKWIQLRPVSERPVIIEKLTPHSGKLSPLFFLTFARWEGQANNIDKAVFWNFLARYRMRYDALRCGAPDSVENMDGLMALMPEGRIVPTVAKQDKSMLVDHLQRVLEFDANYPAENNPAGLCTFINNLEGESFMLVAPKHWNSLRHTLRRATEQEIERLKQTTGAQDPAGSETEKHDNGETPQPE